MSGLGGIVMAAKKKRGRPPKYEHPQTIDATPEEIAEVVLRAKPKTVWRYEEQTDRKRDNKKAVE